MAEASIVSTVASRKSGKSGKKGSRGWHSFRKFRATGSLGQIEGTPAFEKGREALPASKGIVSGDVPRGGFSPRSTLFLETQVGEVNAFAPIVGLIYDRPSAKTGDRLLFGHATLCPRSRGTERVSLLYPPP